MREDSKEWTLVSQEHVNTKKECTQQKKKGIIYMGLFGFMLSIDF